MNTTGVDIGDARYELYPLWQLSKALANERVCFYDANTSYACGQSGQDIPALEVLEVRRDYPEELVRIGYFGGESTRVLYVGEDSTVMRETMRRLELPFGDFGLENAGIRLFSQFRGALRDYSRGVPVAFELQVDVGDEAQLEGVLRKLVEIYSG